MASYTLGKAPGLTSSMAMASSGGGSGGGGGGGGGGDAAEGSAVNLESAILKILCPELALEQLEVSALEWQALGPPERQRGEDAAHRLLEGAIYKIVEAGHAARRKQDEVKERQQKNAVVFRCPACRNQDQAKFREVEGAVICQGIDEKGCGREIIGHRPHEGNFYRSFEGEDDRSHHGKPFNPLFSEAFNSRISCSIEGVGIKAGAKIKAAMNKVEEELSYKERDSDDRRTRDSYKDKHKNKTFLKMADVANNLSLHPRVVERAQWYFAMFRDDRCGGAHDHWAPLFAHARASLLRFVG